MKSLDRKLNFICLFAVFTLSIGAPQYEYYEEQQSEINIHKLNLFDVPIHKVDDTNIRQQNIGYANHKNENPTEDEASVFIGEENAESAKQKNVYLLSSWKYTENLTEHNRQEFVEAKRTFGKFKQAQRDRFRVWKNDWPNFNNSKLKRQFKLFSFLDKYSLPQDKFDLLSSLNLKIQDTYINGTICDFRNPKKCGIQFFPNISDVMKSSRDYDELSHVWEAWRKSVGKPVRDEFTKRIQLLNEAAKINGYPSGAEMRMEVYESKTFEEDIIELYEQLKPFYKQLHAYARRKLREFYGASKIPSRGPIPAHVTGNMWAQTWSNIYDLLVPYPSKTLIDVTETMKRKQYTPRLMFEKSDNFFASLGLARVPVTFWERSILEKQTDRDMDCMPSAWDLHSREDFRIRQCTVVDMEDFITAHHEMGHVQYFIQYKHLPFIFRKGGNPGFHEALGDVISVSVSNPKYLHKIGLLDHYETDKEADINFLLRLSLEKIAFMPFAYLLDRYRWDMMRGKVSPQNYTTSWWKYRYEMQGLAPPVARTEDDFDPASKFHVANDVPYIRYFVSHVLQFQFYKEACLAAKQYDPNDPMKPLHKCDIYQSKEAGDILRPMLQKGMSEHWSTILKDMTGTDKMDLSALLEYFKPLQEWLQKNNEEHGEFIGWEGGLDASNQAPDVFVKILSSSANIAEDSQDQDSTGEDTGEKILQESNTDMKESQHTQESSNSDKKEYQETNNQKISESQNADSGSTPQQQKDSDTKIYQESNTPKISESQKVDSDTNVYQESNNQKISESQKVDSDTKIYQESNTQNEISESQRLDSKFSEDPISTLGVAELLRFYKNMTESSAQLFMEYINRASAVDHHNSYVHTWNYQTNITDYNKNKHIEQVKKSGAFTKLRSKRVDLWQNEWPSFKNESLKRQFKLYSTKGASALPKEKFDKLTALDVEMKENYGTAKICDFKNSSKCDLALDPELKNILRTSRDYEELAHVWKSWRDSAGKPSRQIFTEMSGYYNEVAGLNGFSSKAEFEIDRYESPEFEKEVVGILDELSPLYKQIHAYTRRKLREVYGEDKIPRRGPIPAHVTGHMWAQTWSNLFDILVPFKNKTFIDVTEEMVKQNYTPKIMYEMADDFFASLGMERVPNLFWNKSMIEKPTGREVLCHATAWDFSSGGDYRIKMCTKVEMNDFFVVHHELGHIQYYMQYKHLPYAFRSGPNPGFHEAVGDVLSLSVSTPKHLHKIGLLEKYETDDQADINFLLKTALDKVIILPSEYIIEKFRWDVYRGNTSPQDYTKAWWKLWYDLAGVVPPVVRTEEDFDPAAKFHVSYGHEYIKYFVAAILQFQIYKGTCLLAKEYDPMDPNKPLHRCNIYNSKEAGEGFKNFLKVGSSTHWSHPLEALTGSKVVDASALREYFLPLEKWLQKENERTGEFIGWEGGFEHMIALSKIPEVPRNSVMEINFPSKKPVEDNKSERKPTDTGVSNDQKTPGDIEKDVNKIYSPGSPTKVEKIPTGTDVSQYQITTDYVGTTSEDSEDEKKITDTDVSQDQKTTGYVGTNSEDVEDEKKITGTGVSEHQKTSDGGEVDSDKKRFSATVKVRSDMTEEKANLLMQQFNEETREVFTIYARTSWNFQTNITDFNKKKLIEVKNQANKINTRQFEEINKWKAVWPTFKNETLRRLFNLSSLAGYSALSPDKFEKHNVMSTTMRSTYSTGKICDYKNSSKCDLSLKPDIESIMAKSRDPAELLHAWTSWRDAVGKPSRQNYTEIVKLENEAATLNDFPSAAEFWLNDYESSTFEDDVAVLMTQLRPLYAQLHAYTRRKLRQVYGESLLPKGGCIPAHLTGNMWAQSWWEVNDILMPYPNKTSINVTQALIDQGYTPRKIFETADEFFGSLGLEQVHQSFWNNSMITRPEGREVVCHASAWNFYDGKDVRIKQCTKVNMDDFFTAHHEMGHIQYYMQYKHQPVKFQRGANAAFHEALGDMIFLSVATPKHLHRVGLLESYDTDREAEINFLMQIALSKIAFLPFAYLVDLYRWQIFRGEVTPQNYTAGWWKLRNEIQGISAPLPRTEKDFDPAAKSHVSSGTRYLRYFGSYVLQFQFHKAACLLSNEYDPADPQKQLHMCDIYQSKEAGHALKKMLEAGLSQHWSKTLQEFIGTSTFDGSALREYFLPLEKWLKENNDKHGEKVGWDCGLNEL